MNKFIFLTIGVSMYTSVGGVFFSDIANKKGERIKPIFLTRCLISFDVLHAVGWGILFGYSK